MIQLRILVGLGALAALTAGPHVTARAVTPSGPAAVARCQAAQLTLAPDYGEGDAGHASLVFLVHNRSGQTCALYGYPGAQLLDGAYRGLPTSLQWGGGGDPPRRLVTLASGADAYIALRWAAVPTEGQSCPTAAFVRITVPNASESTIIWPGQGGIRACGGALTASPVEPTQFDFGVEPTL